MTWFRNEVRSLLGKNPTRGDVLGVTFLVSIWVLVLGLVGVLIAVLAWKAWEGAGIWALLTVTVIALAVRAIWTLISLIAQDEP